MNTNHESENIEELKSLASSELFAGMRVRVVDESQRVLFEPAVRQSTGDPSLVDIAGALGVPIVEPPEELLRSGGVAGRTAVGCMLEAHHRILETRDIGDLNTPEGRQQLMEWGKLHDEAHIATFYLSEEQAERIRERLWPNEGLLGATGGQVFLIETSEQVAAINEILQPEIFITFSQEHIWMLQTWPEPAPGL